LQGIEHLSISCGRRFRSGVERVQNRSPEFVWWESNSRRWTNVRNEWTRLIEPYEPTRLLEPVGE
jgi:hypothetical protein